MRALAAGGATAHSVSVEMSKAAKYRIVLLRHGESTWNKENRFTGWTDVPLTEKGHSEARSAGKLLHDAGMTFDVAYTSVLRRAIQTLWYVPAA